MPAFRQQLEASASVPVVALALLVARLQRQSFDVGGAGPLLQEWGAAAAQILAQLGTLPEIHEARKVAQRAIRISQGCEPAARDQGYQCQLAYLESGLGLDRPLTAAECAAVNNSLVHAFAGYAGFLDHADAFAGGRR